MATTPAALDPTDPRAPRLGAYEVLFELAHGGMGTVYLARALGEGAGASGFERLVAVKRLHPHLLSQPESVGRFLEEARVAAHVHHANVVGVHQVGTDDAGQFLVQDYVEGDTLEGLVDRATLRRERLPPPILLRIAIDALAGLHAVHEATDPSGRPLGILHRDVSPQNLLVGRDGVTRLADFGIAKHAQSSVVTDGRYLQGRVLYMPPEYVDRRPVDRRFDVYGVGITLWTALSGAPPWPDASDAQIIHLATTEGIPPLSTGGLAIAPAIEAIVARACRRDPEGRFASAREMLETIEELGRHTGWIASHAEVAALVERLMGSDLTARRAALARRRDSAVTPGASAPDAIASEAIAVEAAPKRRWGAIVAAGAVVLAIGVAAVITASRGETKPASSRAGIPSVTSMGREEPAPSATPSSSARAKEAEPPAPTASISAAPATAPRPVNAPRAKPAATPTAAGDLPGPPSTIATNNPYR